MKNAVSKFFRRVGHMVPTGIGNTSRSYFQHHLDFLHKEGLYPSIHTIDGPSFNPETKINGKEYLTFSSNNYLSLAGNEKVKEVIKSAAEEYGVGSGSTRMLSGTLDIQLEFEKELSDFFGFDGAISFSSGYLANVGVIRMLVDPFPYYPVMMDPGGVIFSDELNHASIIDSVRLAKADRYIYKHNDMGSLESGLKKYPNKRKVIITDGVFSMDGDLADLRGIVKLAKQYDALVYVDDSHGVGVLGPNGEGTAHHLGVQDDVDVVMGSFTKAFGSIGGFIVGKKDIIEYLRVTARSYIFSDPIPPMLVAGLIEAVHQVRDKKEIRERALENAQRLRKGLRELGFTVYGEETTIVPLIIGEEMKAIKFSEELFDHGVLAPCIRKPAVERGKERIRFSVMTEHTSSHIDQLLDICEKIGKKEEII